MWWVTGCRGMLGHDIMTCLAQAGIAHIGTDVEIDISDYAAVLHFTGTEKFDGIINCAAYTAVDMAEQEQEKAFLVNAAGPAVLARYAMQQDIPLIHFSTDYVFDGTQSSPYAPSDSVRPLSTYGRSKLTGEEEITRLNFRYLIFRISWLYGLYGKNFVKTMLRLFLEKKDVRVVNDQIGAPTYSLTLAENIVTHCVIPGIDAAGIFHYQDKASISWYEFAQAIAEEGVKTGILSGMPSLSPVSSAQYPTPVTRPAFSLFDCRATEEILHFQRRGWRLNLSRYIEQLVKHPEQLK